MNVLRESFHYPTNRAWRILLCSIKNQPKNPTIVLILVAEVQDSLENKELENGLCLLELV